MVTLATVLLDNAGQAWPTTEVETAEAVVVAVVVGVAMLRHWQPLDIALLAKAARYDGMLTACRSSNVSSSESGLSHQ